MVHAKSCSIKNVNIWLDRMPLGYGLVKLAGRSGLVQLSFSTSHSPRGFSPVTTQLGFYQDAEPFQRIILSSPCHTQFETLKTVP
jgi:hypothetical protein